MIKVAVLVSGGGTNLQALLDAGVEHALYMDMGAGWNHSFYRDEDGQVHILHPKGHDYPTNWLVVMRG